VIVAAIPIYNEAGRIAEVVAETRRHVDQVVVVDDGSTDDGARRAEEAGATVLRHPANAGKGAALQTALAWAREQPALSALVLVDGDGQHDPRDISRLLAAAQADDLDLVVGSRFLGENNAPLYRLFGLHVLSAAAALGSGVHLTDSQSGFRVLSRRAVHAMTLREPGFAAESEMQYVAAAAGLRVGEVPIGIRYSGPARRSPVVHGVSVLLRTMAMTATRRPQRLPLLLVAPIQAVKIGRTKPANRDDARERQLHPH
jgi:glycosyltransferase involved in cell wall biosynthesis